MSTPTRSRLTMRVNLSEGDVGVIVLQAQDGIVHGQLGDTHTRMEPSEVAHLRGLLGDVLAAALWQRDDW